MRRFSAKGIGPSFVLRRHPRRNILIPFACAALLLVVLIPASVGRPAGMAWAEPSQQTTNVNKPIVIPAANPQPDANSVMRMREQHEKKQDFEAANIERKKQLTDDSARLLALASELKTEVDKTNKDTLSLTVIRKASEIEKLAHDVREKMRLVVGQS